MPFAIILGCSDSRVPIEIIFDRFLGDLFVLRIAGNVVATSQIGSIEFALHHFKTPLIVVLGHSHCGAINASLDECREPTPETDSIHRITSLICPVICKFVGQNLPKKKLEKLSIEANVNNSIKRLKNNSQIIQNRLTDNKLKIVGASYSLRTRKVHFL